VLKEEIAEFEAEIATRKSEIEGLDADFTETSLVRERLELAENLDKAKEDLNGSGKTDAKADASKPGKPDAEEATSASSGLGARKPATKPASKPDAKSSKTTVVVKK
jgi:hypothetical protein